ncbi:MAG: PAS domain S-box protein [Candidatus Lokiarchaeota archaeon]|nr:PAS domain S-box protein [Candidatus Lokiarchaeota archaeon]
MDKIHPSIKELKDIELARYFQKIMEHANEGYILVNKKREILFANLYILRLTLYEKDTLYEMKLEDLIHPDKRKKIKWGFSSLIDGITDEFNKETTLINKNYKHIPIELKINEINWNDTILYLITIRDVSKYKKIEEDLRIKLETILSPEYKTTGEELGKIIDKPKLQSIMDDFYDLTHIGIAINDMKGNVLISTGWQDICTKFHRIHPETRKNCVESDTHLVENVEPGEYMIYKCKNNMWDIATPLIAGGKRLGTLFLGQFFFKEEEIDYEFFEKQAERYGFDKEEYLEALDDVPRWNRETVDTVMHFYTKFASLISQLSYSNLKLANLLENYRRVEERLREKTYQAETAREQSDLYRDLLAHDIANVLTNIKSSVSLLEMKEKEDFQIESTEELLEIIRNQIDKGSNLISKVRKLAEFEDQEHIIQNIDLRGQLKTAVSNVETQFKDHKLVIKTDIPDNGLRVRAGKLLLDAFENILINGIIHNENDIKKLWIRVSKIQDKDKKYVKIEFIDNGIGISDERKKSIFLRKYTQNKSKTGMGIGLSLVKKIINEYKGEISVQNRVEGEYQKGTNFIILLEQV